MSDEHVAPDEFTFSKTRILFRREQHEGEQLVSRAQAKRVARRFEKFSHVILDFDGVAEIGQAFADEIFRVFAREHPGVRLIPENTSEGVAQMIRRAMKAAETPE